MTNEQFDNYHFSINTQVMYFGEWVGVREVWFPERKIGIESGQLLNALEVKDIRN